MEIKYPDAKQKDSFNDGKKYELFVATEFYRVHHIPIQLYRTREEQYQIGESRQGIEIKEDSRCTETGRLSIEIAEKTRKEQIDWIASGIYRNDNSWLYAQGNRQIIFIFGKNILQLLHKSGRYGEHEAPPPPQKPTVRAFYLSIQDAKKYASLIIKPSDQG